MTVSQKSFTPILGPLLWALLALWTLAVGATLAWNLAQVHQGAEELAYMEAAASFDKDLIYRSWAAKHGGVYVPITKETPPNPYLSHLDERDITTPSGRLLTLVNPAYMTRQVHEMLNKRDGSRGHITSLNLLRPENAPDLWEEKALRAFDKGETEVSSVGMIDGQSFFRLMRPLFVEEGCMKCHGHQGYKVGDVRGGLSVAVPMTSHEAFVQAHVFPLTLGHGLLWLLGVGGIGLGTRRIRTRERERFLAEVQMARYEFIVNSVQDVMSFVTRGYVYEAVNDAYCQALDQEREGLLGNTIGDVWGKEAFEADIRKHIDQCLGGETVVYQALFDFEGLGERFCEVTMYPYGDREGQTTHAVIVTRDITERRHSEEELKQRTDELSTSNETMLDREMRTIELKEEVNRLAAELGREAPYPPVWDEAPAAAEDGNATRNAP